MVMWIRFLIIPISAALIASGLAVIVISASGPSALLRGAYDSGAEVKGISASLSLVTAFFSSFSAIGLVDISLVILHYGPARFGVNPPRTRLRSVRMAGLLLLLLYLSVPLSTALACHTVDPFKWFDWLAWGLCLVAVPLAYCRLRKYTSTRRQPCRSLVIAVCTRLRLSRVVQWISKVKAKGYAYEGPEGKLHGLAEGHIRLTFLMLGSVLLSKGLSWIPSDLLPAIIFVLAGLMTFTWFLSGIGFYLQHYRIPVFLPVIVWITVLNLVTHKSYHFRVFEAPRDSILPNAYSVISMRYAESSGATNSVTPTSNINLAARPPRRRIAIAAVGGGIHSGSWAVEVLTRLQSIHGCEDLHKRVVLLSGTSGGSYGLMHYAHGIYGNSPMESCRHGNVLTKDQNEYLAAIREVTRNSSLGAVTRSLVYDDISSHFFPQISYEDRGRAMERRWVANSLKLSDVPTEGAGHEFSSTFRGDLDSTTFADWAADASMGRRPAVLFTSAAEETGRPVVFGSSMVYDWNWNAVREGTDRSGCGCSKKAYTVPIVTGARLSSTFPFVSPAAKPDAPAETLERTEHHLDGGYYDNYGMVALNRWLEEGFKNIEKQFIETTGRKKPDLLTNQIGSKADQQIAFDKVMDDWRNEKIRWTKENGLDHFLVIQVRYAPDRSQPPTASDAFPHQMIAPLNGLYNSRVAGQRLRADEQFDGFCRYWKDQGITIDNAAFEYMGEAALSWHLTATDKEAFQNIGGRIVDEFKEYSTCINAVRDVHDNVATDANWKALKCSKPLGAAAHLVSEFIRIQAANDRSESP
jgi:hypothetical protein